MESNFKRLLENTPDGWTVSFEPMSPEQAYKAFANLVVGYSHSDTGLGGFANARTKTIHLFFQGMKSYGKMNWILAHEIGHAHHFSTNENSTQWTVQQQETYADNYANGLLDRLGL